VTVTEAGRAVPCYEACVHVSADGQEVPHLGDLPGRYQLLPGRYLIRVTTQGAVVASKDVVVDSDEDHALEVPRAEPAGR